MFERGGCAKYDDIVLPSVTGVGDLRNVARWPITVERDRMQKRLIEATEQIKLLQGMLPICALCKKIKEDNGYWNQFEAYISKKADLKFTHGYCPECFNEQMEKMEEQVAMVNEAEAKRKKNQLGEKD